MKNSLAFLILITVIFSCTSSSKKETIDSQRYVDNGLIAMAKKGDKYGFINTNNETVIPFEYDLAATFSEGLACVKRGSKWMFIDPDNNVVIDNLSMEYPSRFNNGFARLHMGFGNMRFINKKGDLSLQQFAELYEFHNGRARATSNDRVPYGYIDYSGDWAISFTENMPDELGEFIEPISSFRNYSKQYFDPYQPSNPLLLYAFMDTTGKQITELKYGNVGKFSDGLCRVSSHKRIPSWGFIDQQGNEVISLKYKEARDFNDGVAAVKGSDWMIIDKSGTVLFKHPWASSLVFSEDLASIWNEQAPRKKGFIDKTGKIIIDYLFDDAFEFKNGFAIIQKNGKMGFIDRSGKIVIDTQYERVDDFVKPEHQNEFKQIN